MAQSENKQDVEDDETKFIGTAIITSFNKTMSTVASLLKQDEAVEFGSNATVAAVFKEVVGEEKVTLSSVADVKEHFVAQKDWHLDAALNEALDDGVRDWTTALLETNLTVVDEELPDTGSASAVGLAVGLTILCILIFAVIAFVVFFILRRKRQKKREKSIVRIENPRYLSGSDSLARRNTLEKSLSLSTAPTVNFQGANNPTVTFERNNGNIRRKEEAPAIYRPSKAGVVTPVKAVKKSSAPLPPTTNLGSKDSVRVPLSNDIYEKDSAHGSMDNVEQTYNLQSVDNPHAPDNSRQSSPLLNSHQDLSRPTSAPTPSDTNSSSSTQPVLDISYRPPPPKPPRISDGSSTENSVASSRIVLNPVENIRNVGHKEGSDEDEGVEEEEEGGASSSMRTALLGEKVKKSDKTMSSNLSLDSYDKTFNPFFADT